MRSIRTKITALTITAVLVSVLAIGGTSIASIKSEGDRHSAQELYLICDNSRRSLNEYLNSIEQSVDMLSRYTGEELSIVELAAGGVVGYDGSGEGLDTRVWDTEPQRRLDAYLHDHVKHMETAFRSVANHTNGVVAYYYRINPEVSREEEGFLFSRVGDTELVEVELTDIGAYDRDDITRVGWYYLPLERGRPSWIEPYYNANLDVVMASYVTPIYKAGTFLGVIGMDISYDTLVGQIQDIRIFDTGYICLADADGHIVFHPDLESGQDLADLSAELAEAASHFREEESGTQPIRYQYGGTAKQMVFSTLSNGMKLVVVAPEAEINASWVGLVNRILGAAALILIAFVLVTALTTKHITEPLQRLTAASRHLAAGDYDMKLEYAGDDEVGVLTQSFQQLVDHLRIYISDLNSKAYQDAMTGVKNKGAYHASARRLNDMIRMTSEKRLPEFALVMLDCNFLKRINDEYGHEKGDVYLQTACHLICQVFTHSPVFRVGGDEFAVILQNDDFHNREELLERFDRQAAEINASAANPWECVHIAKGMAVFTPPGDETVESVLQLADGLMYQDKKRSKAERR